MPKLKPGQSGNPAGRPKGSRNKTTKLTRQFITDFLEEDQPKAAKDWLKLSPWERWQIRTQLLEYAAPKLSRTETTLDVSKLSDEEVNRLFDLALKSLENEN